MIITKAIESFEGIDFAAGQVLLINKDLQVTSFAVVSKIKYLLERKLKFKKIKVGHGGTLDPLATGLMIICIGKETKKQVLYQSDKKEYEAQITLGATRPSFDMETEINERFPTEHITKELIEETLKKSFTGKINQRPPLYSAKYINGVRAYDLARGGIEAELEMQEITIDSITLKKCDLPEITIEVSCSKGTYIRSLANDIGKALNSGAYLHGLKRTSSGEFQLNDALTIKEFEQKVLQIMPVKKV